MIKANVHKGNENLEGVLSIRYEVFVKEQNVSEELEMDGLDHLCTHISLIDEDKGKVFACSRVIEKKDGFYIGRVAVLKEYRGKDYGKMVVLETEKYLKSKYFDKEVTEIFLNAQIQVIDFYKKIGYVEIGDFFYEANIKHKKMKKNLI
ncbi:MAG: GNAT family N-acetyltransferase [Lachnospirales bacterium]